MLIAIFYIWPRNFFRTLFNKEKLKEIIATQLFNPHQPDWYKACSVAFGIFMGIIPIWGFQLAAAIFLAVVMKLNKTLVIIAANISVPPMIPLIIYGSYKMGTMWMSKTAVNLKYTKALSLQSIQNNLTQYIYGSVTLAFVAAIVIGLLFFILLRLFKKAIHVRNKLATDG